MGLIQAFKGAIQGTIADQWKEVIQCDTMGSRTLIKKGHLRLTDKSQNVKGEKEIISNGSKIFVAEGQCALIVDSGKIRDVVMESGGYEYKNDAQPSIFANADILGLITQSWKRLGYGGQPSDAQWVYYVNLKEITGNKFGTQSPLSYRVVDEKIGLDMEMQLGVSGIYSFKIEDPVVFYSRLASNNFDEEFTIDALESQLKTEFINQLGPVFVELGGQGTKPSDLMGKTAEIAKKLNERLTEEWKELRGITVVKVALNTINISDEDRAKLQKIQQMGSAAGQQARMMDVMEGAATNKNGAMAGLFGMGLAGNAMGANGIFGGMFGGNQNQNQGWKCECGTVNQGKFCSNCGKSQPQSNTVKCPKCGTDNAQGSKFCGSCGEKLA